MDEVLYCSDLRSLPGFPGCCHSCHDDHDDYGMDLCELYDGEKLTHMVCCTVYEWLADSATGAKDVSEVKP